MRTFDSGLLNCAVAAPVRLQGSQLNFLLDTPCKSLVESEEW